MYSRILARSRDKRKSLHIHYQNACGYQTWQGGYIQLVACFKNLTQTFNHVVLQSLVKY